MTPETILLEDASGNTRARVMPALGFNCYSFQVLLGETPVEVLWSDPDFAGGEKRPTRSGIPILFPFAGRIGGTTFRYAQREYHLEPSDEFGNAIHGFVVHRPWRVVERSSDSVTGEFQASRDDPAILVHWPADFRIRVSYRVTAGTLRGEVAIDNPGSGVLPCGLGLHGYYRVPLGTGPAAQCMVRVPVGERWELENMLPTGSPHAHRSCHPTDRRHAVWRDAFGRRFRSSGGFRWSLHDIGRRPAQPPHDDHAVRRIVPSMCGVQPAAPRSDLHRTVYDNPRRLRSAGARRRPAFAVDRIRCVEPNLVRDTLERAVIPHASTICQRQARDRQWPPFSPPVPAACPLSAGRRRLAP